jgi:hypothetical protein
MWEDHSLFSSVGLAERYSGVDLLFRAGYPGNLSVRNLRLDQKPRQTTCACPCCTGLLGHPQVSADLESFTHGESFGTKHNQIRGPSTFDLGRPERDMAFHLISVDASFVLNLENLQKSRNSL